MNKLIVLSAVVLFSVLSVFAHEYSFSTSSGLDTIFAVGGEQINETYSLCGEEYIDRCELEFDCGCFANVLNNDTVIYLSGDDLVRGQCNVSDYGIASYVFNKPWGHRQLVTLSGVMKENSPNPRDYVCGQISFMVRARIFEDNGDTVRLEKQFTIRRIEPQTFDEIMSNGANRVEYKGMEGYLIYCGNYTPGYFISDSSHLRYVVPYTTDGDEYTEAVVSSWGWDMSKAKKISNSVIINYALKENVLVKPGFCAFKTQSGLYYESNCIGMLNGIDASETADKYGQKIIPIFDCFLTNYNVSTTSVKPASKPAIRPMRRQGSLSGSRVIDLCGRKVNSIGNSSFGLRLVQSPNGMVKNLSFNGRIR